MASDQGKGISQEPQRPTLVSKKKGIRLLLHCAPVKGKQPQITKNRKSPQSPQPPRQSESPHRELLNENSSKHSIPERNSPPLSAPKSPSLREQPQDFSLPLQPLNQERHEKANSPNNLISAESGQIRTQKPFEDPCLGETVEKGPFSSIIKDQRGTIHYCMTEETRPKNYFEPNDMTRVDFETARFEAQLREEMNMSLILARPKYRSSHDVEKSREAKGLPYADQAYEILLESRGSFMDPSDLGTTDDSKAIVRKLLNSKQPYPRDSLFQDELFDRTCRDIRARNEAIVIRDISTLIAPSAQHLSRYGSTHLKKLVEGVNKSWSSSIPSYGPRPQPDYTVGFARTAFTDDQLQKLYPLIGEFETSMSYFWVPGGFTSHS